MVCYLTVVWSLARFRIARLLTLGIGGAFLAIGWLAFRDDAERAFISGFLPIPEALPVRPLLCWLLAALSAGSCLLAYVSVESQRRGGSGEWHGLRRLIEFMSDALPRRRRPFGSARRAQFWFKWRRHGVALPLSTAGVVLVIMGPAPCVGP